MNSEHFRKLAKIALAAVLMAGMFLTGFVVHRNRLPPYELLTGLYRNINLRYAAYQFRTQRPGTWYPSQHEPSSQLTAERQARLRAVPYLQGYSRATGASGVIKHDEGHTSPGETLLLSAHGPEAYIIRMDGSKVHGWTKSLREVWPDYRESPADFDLNRAPGTSYWRSARMLPDGGIVALFDQIGIIRLDRASRLVWATRCRCHHALALDRDGSIYSFSNEITTIDKVRVMTDQLIRFTSDGKEARKLSLTEAFSRSAYASVLNRAFDFVRANGEPDLLHANSIQLSWDSVTSASASRALVSIPTADTVADIDLSNSVVVWALSNLWSFQHDPRWLDNGNLLVFDNGRGKVPPVSRVLEVDPRTQRLIWSFEATSGHPFFTAIAGGSQRLPNGNTLIVESARGRVFEVTQNGRVVWEYLNPHRAGQNGELIATIYEATRFVPVAAVNKVQ